MVLSDPLVHVLVGLCRASEGVLVHHHAHPWLLARALAVGLECLPYSHGLLARAWAVGLECLPYPHVLLARAWAVGLECPPPYQEVRAPALAGGLEHLSQGLHAPALAGGLEHLSQGLRAPALVGGLGRHLWLRAQDAREERELFLGLILDPEGVGGLSQDRALGLPHRSAN